MIWILLAVALNAAQTDLATVPLDIFSSEAACEAKLAEEKPKAIAHSNKTQETIELMCVKVQPKQKVV